MLIEAGLLTFPFFDAFPSLESGLGFKKLLNI